MDSAGLNVNAGPENKPSAGRSPLKYVTVVVLAAFLAAAGWYLFGTADGRRLRADPRLLSDQVHAFVDRHWIAAPLGYLTLYVALGILALPVWWLQLLGGIGFGLYYGCSLSVIASTVCAVTTVALARWIAADWFRARVESRLKKLKNINQTMGHNGLLVVMSIRLMHLLPFGLCNYALGLSEVSYTDIALGTFLGSIPALAIYVGLGAGYRPLHNWKFDMAIGSINIVLLIPLALRYLRPQWFKKIGV